MDQSDTPKSRAPYPSEAPSNNRSGLFMASEQSGRNSGTSQDRKRAREGHPGRTADYEVLRGEVVRIRYENREERFSIFDLQLSRSTSPLTVIGSGPALTVGIEVVVTGEHAHHKKFGPQFKAKHIALIPPSSELGITRYLASGIFPGIGAKLASRISRHFGNDTLAILEQHPERIVEVPGIGKQKAEAIIDQMSEHSSLHEIGRFLSEYQVSPSLAEKIYKRYGKLSIEKLKENPYLLARDLSGVGFKTADSVAVRLGVQPESEERHRAGLLYALEQSREDGHTYLPREKLFGLAEELLSVHHDESEHLARLEELQEERSIIVEDNRVYLRLLYQAEKRCAESIVAKISSQRRSPLLDESDANASLSRVERELNFSFSLEQRSAVHAALKHRLLLLTGGPGCGKTTVTKAIVETLKTAGCTILLTAPTGKAAQRLSQVCSFPAKTIHRLLKFDPFTRTFSHNAHNPLTDELGNLADVVIVDESSMIDLPLAEALLSAIPQNASLVLIGDKDQLPSVGPGRVFAELLSIIEIPKITLTFLYRRESTSLINNIAHQINAGIPPEIPSPDGEYRGNAYFIERNDAESAANLVESLFIDQIPKKFGISRDDITILTPTNRGPLGTLALNQRIQRSLHSDATTPFQLTNTETPFYLEDRVCQRKNNYQIDELGVFNGDTGKVISIEPTAREVVIELWDGRNIRYSEQDAKQLTLAYALTVHRSQGSELPCVILTLHESHYALLERQLIYTAVTRAKELLIIVGSKKALSLAAKRTQSSTRFTWLKDRILHLLM